MTLKLINKKRIIIPVIVRPKIGQTEESKEKLKPKILKTIDEKIKTSVSEITYKHQSDAFRSLKLDLILILRLLIFTNEYPHFFM